MNFAFIIIMKYIGLYAQQRSNNVKSLVLLFCFPCLVLLMVYGFIAFIGYLSGPEYYDEAGYTHHAADWAMINQTFLTALPWVVGGVAVWFLIAYASNTAIIRASTGAHTISRRDNPRIYNIVENLCMTCGMPMPKVNVVDDPQLNAFACGINQRTYTVTVTTGICERLNDEELAGVIGHELTHIRNRDTRLLIVSIIFVGIMSFVLSMAIRMMWNTFIWGGGTARGRSSDDRDSGWGTMVSMIVVMLVAVVFAALGYFFTILTRFAISRRREYMADAGGAELCGNPRALASALRKISGDPGLQAVKREDVAQLFICRPRLASGAQSLMSGLFSTHPDIKKRIAFLEQL